MTVFLEKLISKIINNFSIADLEQLEAKIRQVLFTEKMVGCRFASFLHWQKPPIHWNDYSPPWRPSKSDLKNYEEILSALPKNGRVLILGATPELRDLAASLGFKPVVVDFSLPMIIEMLRYTEKVNIDDEIWLKSDWLEAPLSDNFDAVLGDQVLRLISMERQDEFLNKIQNILSPGGIFVTRLHFVDESLFNLTGDEILSLSLNIPENRLAANMIVGRIFDKFSDLNKNIINQEEAIVFLQKAVKKASGSREKTILSRALAFTLGGIGWPVMREENKGSANSKVQLENLLGKFFDIVDVKTAVDYPDSKFYPIYFLKIKR